MPPSTATFNDQRENRVGHTLQETRPRAASYNRCQTLFFRTILSLSLAPLWIAFPDPSGAQEPTNDDWSAMTNAATVVIAEVNTAAIPLAEVAEVFDGQTIRIAIDLPYSMTHPWMRVYLPRESPELAESLRAKSAGGLHVGEGERLGDWWRYDVSPWPVDGDNLVGDEVLDGERPELVQGLSRAGERPIRIGLAPPAHFARIFSRLSPTLPASFGGGESRVVLNDVRFATLGIDPEANSVDIDVQTVSGPAAIAVAEQLPQILAGLATLLPVEREWTRRMASLRFNTDGERVHWRAEPQLLAHVAAELTAAAAQRRARARRTDRLKRFGLAIHNYIDLYKSFPPAKGARDADGNPRLSWRVHILPFIGQADLYREFRLNEPWDSEHNRGLIGRMPDLYAWPGVPRGQTVVQAPVGEGTIFGGDRPVTFRDVTDGTSNTAMLVLVAPERAVTWTAPDDFRFDPERPQEGLDADDNGLAAVAAADGSARLVPVDLPPRTWRHVFQMNDGQIVRW